MGMNFNNQEQEDFQGINNIANLILSVIDYFSQFDNEIIETITIRKMPHREAIVFFIRSYAEYYENYPAIIALTESYNELANNTELSVIVKEIYMKRLTAIQDIIKNAQENGAIRQDVCCESIGDVINGMFRSICLRWRFCGRGFPLKEHTMLTLNMILNAFFRSECGE